MPTAAIRPRRPTASIALLAVFALVLNSVELSSQSSSFDSRSGQRAPAANAALDREVRSDMAFLADDELHGRGSATRDEHIAALFAAAQFQALGLAPGGDHGTFIQKSLLPAPLPARVQQHFARFEDTPRTETWNAVAILRGAAPSGQPEETVLLTAHLDHFGVAKADPAKPGADLIYNGADDNASGTAAVLALAHALAPASPKAPPLRRTIVFALFGSEEIGGLGNAAFLAHPPVPLGAIVANLEFEMIGRPDPAIPADSLWLTGYDRSTLGPELAKHGAHLVADPHPAENFFRRSDNYALARQGIVAHTVSSFGLHKDYHQPSDELATIDFAHLTGAIASMIEPVRWLATTSWRAAWNSGGMP
jgi:hypothetical protein